ncbi:MAG: hypothetical protein MJ250_03560 [Alphaproteobacteria bacterium]|nr:hypothetical protein [Alphaproteobacteria bacterium]
MLLIIFFYFIFSPQISLADEEINWTRIPVTEAAVSTEEKVKNLISSDEVYIQTFGKSLEKAKANLKHERIVKAVSGEDVFSSLLDFFEKSYPGGVKAMERDHKNIENDIYNLIKMMPKEYYQYIGPFIHDVPYMSERILNIPGIKETKGKLPTRIAPQMKEYVRKYGKYMSKHLYIYLMPEVWNIENTREEDLYNFKKTVDIDNNLKISDIFSIKTISLLDKYPIKENFKEIKSYTPKQEQTKIEDVTQDSTLTAGDIEAGLRTVDELNEAFGSNRLDKFHHTIRNMNLVSTQEELRNPMLAFKDKVLKLPEKKIFMRILSRNQFTPETWALTMDKIIKAHRVAHITPAISLNIATWKQKDSLNSMISSFSERDKKVTIDSLQLFADLYTSSRENVLAVKKYSDRIRKAFLTRDMMVFESPVYGIY